MSMSTDLMLSPGGVSDKQKNALQRAFDRAMGSGAVAKAKRHAIAGAHAVRQSGESLVMGGLLGAAHVELKTGLDIRAGKAAVPLDGVAGVVLAAAGVALADEEVGTDLRNAGAAALSVFAFRKSYEVVAAHKIKRGGTPGGVVAPRGTLSAHGDFGAESPLVLNAGLIEASQGL